MTKTSDSGREDAARREGALRISGSVGANRAMASELLRLVKRSPFAVRLPKPRRQGSAILRYPFDPSVAWVAACYHRSCSTVGWELCSSPARRLEALHDDLVPLLQQDERLEVSGQVRFSVEVRDVSDFEAGPLQVRGVVKSALQEAVRLRGGEAVVDAEAAELRLSIRRSGPEEDRRTWLMVDLGGPGRHRRGHRVAMVEAPLRETLAAQLLLLARWDPRREPLIDPMAGGGTIAIEAAHFARGTAVRQPGELPLARLPALAGLPAEAPPLYPDARPWILATDASSEAIPAMIGNFRAAGLTGPDQERRLVVRQIDVRDLSPDAVRRLLPDAPLDAGVFCFNPPYGKRLAPQGGQEEIRALYRDTAQALSRFPGWRIVVFVANEDFLEAWQRKATASRPAAPGALRGEIHVFESSSLAP